MTAQAATSLGSNHLSSHLAHRQFQVVHPPAYRLLQLRPQWCAKFGTFAAEAFAPEAPPSPSQDPANPAGSPTPAPVDSSNTTITLAPEAGISALLGNNGSAINTTIVQQLTFTGPLHTCRSLMTSQISRPSYFCHYPNTSKRPASLTAARPKCHADTDMIAVSLCSASCNTT